MWLHPENQGKPEKGLQRKLVAVQISHAAQALLRAALRGSVSLQGPGTPAAPLSLPSARETPHPRPPQGRLSP